MDSIINILYIDAQGHPFAKLFKIYLYNLQMMKVMENEKMWILPFIFLETKDEMGS